MKIVKFSYLNEKKISYGRIYKKFIIPISNSIYEDKLITKKGVKYDIKKCKFYLPINSSKIIGVAQNFKKENKINNPLFFLKSNNSLCLQDKNIRLPKNAKIWGESELAFVIKKSIKKPIKLRECKKYILGYTIANDITASYNNGQDHHLALSKSLDGFCPIADFIDTKFTFNKKIIEGLHNNKLIRRSSTSKFILNPHQILSHLSNLLTLNPGDLILTGAPTRVTGRKYLKAGDNYLVKISGLGKIISTFK